MWLTALLALLLVFTPLAYAQISGNPPGHVIMDETTNLRQQPTLRMTGAGVTCTDDSANRRTVCTISGGGGGGSGTVTSIDCGFGLVCTPDPLIESGTITHELPAADDQVYISDSTSDGTWRSIPNCLDTGGQHLNYTAASNTLSCGTSGGAGGGAPADATYWVSSANGTLSNEVDLGALTTGLVLNTVAAGVGTPSAFGGDTCGVGDFATGINADGSLICDTASASDVKASQLCNFGPDVSGVLDVDCNELIQWDGIWWDETLQEWFNASIDLVPFQVPESQLAFTDVTTANVTTSQHGLMPKAPADTDQVFYGDAAWRTAGGEGPPGRCTTETGVAVSNSDRTSQGTLYYTIARWVGHNKLRLYTSSQWKTYAMTSELSLSLSLTSGKNYDVFIYDNSGTLTLELSAAWTDDTTRADALTTQDGVLVKSGSISRFYVCTIRASGSNVTEDSMANRFVWNMYNRIHRKMAGTNTNSHTYTSGTVRKFNNDNSCDVSYVIGGTQIYQGGIIMFGGTIRASATLDAKEDWASGGGSFLDYRIDDATAYSSGMSGDIFVPGSIGKHTVSLLQSSTNGTTGDFASGVLRIFIPM